MFVPISGRDFCNGCIKSNSLGTTPTQPCLPGDTDLHVLAAAPTNPSP